MTKPKAYYQAFLVLKCLSKEEYSLIPQSLLDEITLKMEKDDSIVVDSTVPLDKQKIDEKTYDILDRVIKAIEKAYGKDAIDNPEKYADIERDETIVRKQEPKREISNNKHIDEKNSFIESEKIRKLQDENIKLRSIIDLLKEENKKIDKAKELFGDYKEIVVRKDQKIQELNKEMEALKKANEELKQEIDKLPRLIRRIFIKDTVKKLT